MKTLVPTKDEWMLPQISPVIRKMQRSHLVYEYTCNYGECKHQKTSYVGNTATALSRRVTMHLEGGAHF